MIDALGTGLWAHHMLHGARAVPPDLFSKALALLVEGHRRSRRHPRLRRCDVTDATDIKRPRFARMYPKAAAAPTAAAPREHRRRLLAGLSGRVVELGAGNGLNFAHYPTSVSRSDRDRARAQPARRRRGRRRDRRRRHGDGAAGTAERLPLADGELDAAVASLVLCSVPDQAARSPSCTACCAPAASCASTST